MRIGEHYKIKCEPRMLVGYESQFVQSLKYLGVQYPVFSIWKTKMFSWQCEVQKLYISEITSHYS